MYLALFWFAVACYLFYNGIKRGSYADYGLGVMFTFGAICAFLGDLVG